MTFAISPRHNLDEFPNGLTLDNKITIFIDRVEGWMLGPAKQIIESGLGHRGFVLLAIVTSYFEMIAKYQDGFAKDGSSGWYFKKGLQFVFPGMALPDAQQLLNSLYERLRNGLYHAGMTGPNIILVNSSFGPGSIGFDPTSAAVVIAPDTLVDDLLVHFRSYATRLSDPSEQILRANFERRFEYDNTLPVQDSSKIRAA